MVHVWKEKTTLDGVLTAGYNALLSNQDFWYLEYVLYYYLLPPYPPNITISNPTTTTTSHLSTTWDQMYTNEPTAGLSATSDPALILGGKCSYTSIYSIFFTLYVYSFIIFHLTSMPDLTCTNYYYCTVYYNLH